MISKTRKNNRDEKKSKNSYFEKRSSRITRDRALSMTCPLCHEEIDTAGAAYCASHQRAFENVKRAFSTWTVAYGSPRVPDFLEQVQKLPQTGLKAKEICRFLLENPSRWK